MHLSLEESEEFGPQMYLKWWSATGLTASVFLIELDRFLAIRFPLKYPFFITCERSLGTCAVTVLNYISIMDTFFFVITIVSNINLKVCLQNEASFGKSQLLIAPTLANQNKNKKGVNFDFYCLKLRTVLFSGTIV